MVENKYHSQKGEQLSKSTNIAYSLNNLHTGCTGLLLIQNRKATL